MKVENLRSLIRESINEYIREIDNAGNQAALEAKIAATEGAIEKREKMANMEGIDEAYHDMLDKGKMKEIGGEVKALKKSLDKLKKQLDKLNSKSEPKAEVIKDEPVDESYVEEMDMNKKAIVPEIELEEARSKKGKDVKKMVKKDEEVLNESFIKMQKLAGVITESQYNEKVKSLNEGFLDNVAAGLKGKSEQGKLAQDILAKLGITKNPAEIFGTGAEGGGAGPFENEVQDFVEKGGDINTKIPFSKNIKSSSGGAIFKETYTFDFGKDVPTMKSGGKFIWDIKGGKWEKFGDQDGNENQEDPIDIESMKKESDAEPGSYATEATMMTIADAAKIWPGGYGERLRDIIAEKSGSQPQQESLAKFKVKK